MKISSRKTADKFDALLQSWLLLRSAFGIVTNPVHPTTMSGYLEAIVSGVNKLSSDEARVFFANADQRLTEELRKAGHEYEEFFKPVGEVR